MEKVKVIEVKEGVLGQNDLEAKKLRDYLKEKKVCFINVMSSPGSGKTSTLIKVINLLKDEYQIAVMEADIDSAVDALKIKESCGIEAIQIHTGGMCHLDATMCRQGLDLLDIDNLDLVFLENVGNLVCPCEYDTGAYKSMTILSIPEGDDKPLKYPLMYESVSLALINKIDVLPIFNFNLTRCEEEIKQKNADCEFIPVSAKTGEGIDKFADWLKKQIEEWRK